MAVQRIAVVIPGIMGSVLAYPGAHEIWGQNFYDNYQRLLTNPALLHWNGIAAQATLLEDVYITRVVPWPKYRLWRRLLRYFQGSEEFGQVGGLVKFAYDWRQSLLETAEQLGSFLNAIERSTTETKFVLLTHSMGGLVARIALAHKHVEPNLIDRIVHIGAPLLGAPSAFGSAYGGDSLPMLHVLSNVVHWKNADRFFDLLLDNLRSFPSIYQLMPPKSDDYLWYSRGNRKNPLNEPYISNEYKQLADKAHSAIQASDLILLNLNIPTFTIYTALHNQRQTDLAYAAQPLPGSPKAYQIKEIVARTDFGDGTVPADSACGNVLSCKPNPVHNVTHVFMCNNENVVDLLPGML